MQESSIKVVLILYVCENVGLYKMFVTFIAKLNFVNSLFNLYLEGSSKCYLMVFRSNPSNNDTKIPESTNISKY